MKTKTTFTAMVIIAITALLASCNAAAAKASAGGSTTNIMPPMPPTFPTVVAKKATGKTVNNTNNTKEADSQLPQSAGTIVVPPPVFEFGSTNIVADHAARMTDQFWLSVYQPLTNGTIVYFARVQNIRGFTNMNDLNSWLRWSVTTYTTNVLGATNKSLLDGQFIAYASAVDWADSYSLANCYSPFYLIKNGNNYSLPDFSSISMSLESDMPYHATNINWAVMQVYNSASNTVVDILDSRFDDPSTSIVDYYNQLLVVPTAYVSGNYKFRLVVESGTDRYGVFGAQGDQIPEIREMPNWYDATNNIQHVTMIPGDVGRYLSIQASSDNINWTNVTTPRLTYYTGFDVPTNYSETNQLNGARFFRLYGESAPY